MNSSKVKQIINFIQEELGNGILSADIYSANDGQSLGGINSKPKVAALLARVTAQLQAAIKAAGFKGLGPYYLITIEENMVAVVIPMGTYECGMMIDTNKAKTGLVLNVVLPGILDIAMK
jgi:hypothetical protein